MLNAMPPQEYVAFVAEALGSLYDPPALLRCSLRPAIAPDSSPEAGARFLRRALLEAIEAINPGPKVPFRSPAARSYEAVRLHYVEGRTVEEIARELATSERQTYRDIRKGEADVATVLWTRHRNEVMMDSYTGDPDLRQELDRLHLSPSKSSLSDCLSEAVIAVRPLAGKMGVDLVLEPSLPATVAADQSALRQCLIALLSCAVQSGARKVLVRLVREYGATVTVRCLASGPGVAKAPSNLSTTMQALAEAIGASFKETCTGKESVFALEIAASRAKTLLVIDDNEGLPQLFERYLQDLDCYVHGVADPSQGLAVAREAAPDAIILDILMPGTDGWTLLGKLTSDPATATIPVIVCSVFNDPELAKALGAAAFIAKPVRREALLRVLVSLRLS